MHEKVEITRTGKSPLSFTGNLVGTGSSMKEHSRRWSVVRLYVTVGGNFIGHVCYVKQTCEIEIEAEKAEAFKTLKELEMWLKDGHPTLGPASQNAFEEAIAVDLDFADYWKEEVA
jgi:hypothetical protein